MKIIFLTILFFAIENTYAKSCEVYGISDSPQKLNCSFKSMNIRLSCVQGTYFINSSKVSQAFHMEVESGPVPLVFEAPNQQLTVLVHSKRNIRAEVAKSGTVFYGRCR